MEESTQVLLQRALLRLCTKIGGNDLEKRMYKELTRPECERPTPPRVYEFEEYLVIDRPFTFTDPNFLCYEVVPGELFQIRLSYEEEGDHYRVLACVTRAGNAKSKVPVVGTLIGGRECFEGKTNPQGKRAFSLVSKEESDSLIVAVAVSSKQKTVEIELHVAP